jgi:hypothetical protein
MYVPYSLSCFAQELARYIHLNPLRAKFVEDTNGLKRLPYSGHSALVGRIKRPWQDTDYVLSFFGRKLTKPRQAYGAYVQSGIGQGRGNELTGGGSIYSKGRTRDRVEARSLFCYWAVRELGLSNTTIAKQYRILSLPRST